MDIAVWPGTGRRRGATKENNRYGSSTEEQRSRRPVPGQTLRAEVLLALRLRRSSVTDPLDMIPRRSSRKAKNPLSGGIHSFLTGC